MKCLRKECWGSARPDRVYCSRDCARVDQQDLEPGARSEEMERSSIKESGAASVPPSGNETSLETDTLNRNNLRSIGPGSASATMRGMLSGEIITSNESGRPTDLSPSLSEDRGADGLIRLMDSLKPSGTSETATSHSMNLIDESAMHLRGLMKSVAPSSAPETTPEQVKSVCDIAKQMANLLRLKLEILKEFRR